MWATTVPVWNLVLRSVVIYLALLVGLRLFGKREVGQFTLFDLVLVLLVANAVQPAITGPDSTLAGGLVIMVTMFLANLVVARMRHGHGWFRRLAEGQPTIIARHGHWLFGALYQEGLSQDECLMALREHGLANVDQVGLAVLETDGTISVVPDDAFVKKGRRRVRSEPI